VFFTNIIFLATKLIDANALANTETNIFYSAYLKNRVQYNYVDPDKTAHAAATLPLIDMSIKDESPQNKV
jgi:hypothetical protein